MLLEDLIRYGSQATLSAAEDMVLREAFLGLHYVWRMRIRASSITAFTPELMERLRGALLLFMGRVNMRGPVPFLAKPVPTREAVFAFTIFCGMLKDVIAFREVVNNNMTVADLRRALAVHLWLSITEVEEDEGAPDEDITNTVGWSSIKFSVEDIRRLAVVTVLFLTGLLNACNDWEELVEPRAHALFQKYQKVAQVENYPDRKPKPLLAPKGEYWDTDVKKVLGMFRTQVEKGLTEAEVLARREVYGDNRTPPMARASVLGILFRQLADLIVIILLVASVVSACLGDYKTAVVLGIVVSINTAIGFYQEWNAERAISALASLSVPQCTVIRGGTSRMVEAGDLVPGDIVVLDEGAAVPADLRLCSVSQLAIIETLLTGESVPMEKITDAIHGYRRVNIGDRTNMAFQSTVVSRGRGVGVVVNTGETTEIGRISAAIAGTHVGKTPLQKKMDALGKMLVMMAIFACGLVVVAGIIWDPRDMGIIKVGISLALSVIPEGLVAIVTLTMALGMKRMAKGNALVRQLPAVETLGSVTTICSDKTGTITEGVMRARLMWAPEGHLHIPMALGREGAAGLGLSRMEGSSTHIVATALSAAVGTQGTGNAKPVRAEKLVPVDAAAQWQLAIMAICNNSTLNAHRGMDGCFTGIGDQTEVALKVLAVETGLSWPETRLKRGAEIAFDSDRKRMSVVCSVMHESEDGPVELGNCTGTSRLVLSKGAPEVVLGLCSEWMGTDGKTNKMDATKLKEVDAWCDAFSAQGLRTLALAMRFDDSGNLVDDVGLDEEKVEVALVFVGLVALADPPRKGIEQSIKACHDAGIRVVMITGDHVRTATSIAQSVGILDVSEDEGGSLVLNGSALSSMTVEQLAILDPFPVVFSRVSPDNKLNIVKALQMRGDVVAMTGDGVNDAPAIRQADVGVAMGRSGTDITRQAADIILADDNFSTIVVAVAEGRKIMDNIIKFLVYLLSCNLSEVILMLVAVSAGYPEPLNALQILYANIVVDIPPSLALGAEQIEPDAMFRTPRNPQKPILGKRYTLALIVQASSIGLLSFGSYVICLDVEKLSLEQARSEAFAVVFIVQCAHSFMSRSIRNSLLTSGPRELFFGNMWLLWGCTISVLAVVAGIYTPGFNSIFGLVPIDGRGWLKVLVALIVHLCIVEFGKWRIRHVIPKSTSVTSPFGGERTSMPLARLPVVAGVERAISGSKKVEKTLAGASVPSIGEAAA